MYCKSKGRDLGPGTDRTTSPTKYNQYRPAPYGMVVQSIGGLFVSCNTTIYGNKALKGEKGCIFRRKKMTDILDTFSLADYMPSG